MNVLLFHDGIEEVVSMTQIWVWAVMGKSVCETCKRINCDCWCEDSK